MSFGASQSKEARLLIRDELRELEFRIANLCSSLLHKFDCHAPAGQLECVVHLCANLLAIEAPGGAEAHLSKGLGHPAFRHCRLNAVAVDVDNAVNHFDKHFTKLVLPNVPEHSRGSELQIALRRRVASAQDFGEERGIHACCGAVWKDSVADRASDASPAMTQNRRRDC